MNLNDVKDILSNANEAIVSEQRLTNDTGWQLRLRKGTVVNVFDKGTVNCQGADSSTVKQLFVQTSAIPALIKKRKIFVVYGHDTVSRNQLETMLRRWCLEPLILDQLPSGGQTVIEKLETYISEAEFAIVLATPDDEGFKAGHSSEKAYRARQNVVLELGMLLAKLGRERVAILLKQETNMERPSDIQGLIYIPFKDDVQKETGVLLCKELASQGYDIDIKNL